jgi:hypothetical protein
LPGTGSQFSSNYNNRPFTLIFVFGGQIISRSIIFQESKDSSTISSLISSLHCIQCPFYRLFKCTIISSYLLMHFVSSLAFVRCSTGSLFHGSVSLDFVMGRCALRDVLYDMCLMWCVLRDWFYEMCSMSCFLSRVFYDVCSMSLALTWLIIFLKLDNTLLKLFLLHLIWL